LFYSSPNTQHLLQRLKWVLTSHCWGWHWWWCWRCCSRWSYGCIICRV